MSADMYDRLNDMFGLDEIAHYDAHQAEFYRKIMLRLMKLPIPDIARVQAEQIPELIENELTLLKADAERYRALNTPEIKDFIVAVEREAIHQRERWGNEHDAGKTDADWFWLIGYLAGKTIRPDATPEKQLHHIITAAAALLNWHAAKLGIYTAMRPGIDGEAITR